MTYTTDPDWQALLELSEELEALHPRMHDVPVRVWNGISDRQVQAMAEVRENSQLLHELRSADDSQETNAQRALRYAVLTGAVLDHLDNPETILRDSRVADVAAEIELRPALYFAERRYDDEPDPVSPYESETVSADDSEARDLSRIGGVATRSSRTSAPAGLALLVQLDCAMLVREAQWDARVAAVLERFSLPPDGLLQVFHTTLGDSHTDPSRSGGGAQVRHLIEAEVQDRQPIEHDPFAYEPFQLNVAALPSFTTVLNATGDAMDRVAQLQEEVDRYARGGNFVPGFLEALAHNPFRASAGTPTRMFAHSAPDFGVTIEDGVMLSARLPLAGPGDEHVLLFDVAGDPAFNGVFGDDGRLEIWMRKSDLVESRFGEVESIIRSA